ncbi:efflux RND transporter periplasmic adaptor subunit [Limnoglobus roseus]|uniref:Efflux RND transporter periplasmic adaptor subunit n=1 Tax=Limnoglobus roseus TaxID=2598579 RepID=A0A5C1AGU7_9BACT|nr:efflux RND transporter periplasmic adaptor subunit [Limnoglobus roseus]
MRRIPAPVLILCLLFAGCTKPPGPRPEAPPPPVTVAVSEKRTVPVQVRTIGTVKTVATVAIRPRVGGQLTEVLFKEGEYVKKDQKLLTIDPRPYQAAVKLAEATLAKSRAMLKGAELDLERLEKVDAGGAASGVELDKSRTVAAAAKASVAIDEASLDSAKIQAGYTTITSPLDGRVGELLVNQGNLVEANGLNPLVVIHQVSPIFVTFALPEQELPAVAAAQAEAPLTVEALLREGEPPMRGKLAFIDNAVNVGSGTMSLKAEFPNRDHKLWPGQFVDVVLTLRDRPDSVLIPTAAVQAGQRGTFVFVVNAERKVELRPVTVAFETDREAVISSGLSAGETVVTEGQLRLVAGLKVDVKAGLPVPAVGKGKPE